MRSHRRTGCGASPRLEPSNHRRAVLLLFAVCAASVLLAGAPALAQTGYTGVPLPPPEDTYVTPYTGSATSRGVPVRVPAPTPARASNAAISVGSEPAQALDPGQRNVVTASDLVAVAALGMTGAVAFALSGRLRSRR
jgi:hypothetical protein